jgi:hypothetical protein
MTYQYQQHDGQLTEAGAFVGTGYSGTGLGRNAPEHEDLQGVGPIPAGGYVIGKAYDHPHLGPCVMNLDPLPGTDTKGRSLFRIHGNNAANDASHGCIILGPAIRHQIAESGDCTLHVIH